MVSHNRGIMCVLNYHISAVIKILCIYIKSSHLYLYSAFNNTNFNKALHNIKIGKFVHNVK